MEFCFVHDRTPVQDHASAVVHCEKPPIPAFHLTPQCTSPPFSDFEIRPILLFCEQLHVVVCALWSRPELDCDILPSIVFNLVRGCPFSMLPRQQSFNW